MQEKQLVIGLDDLDRGEIKCANENCTGSLTLDLIAFVDEDLSCPVCKGREFRQLARITRAWRTLRESPGVEGIQFRLKAQ